MATSRLLIKTLLSHCPDPENVINTLCWPSTSLPDIETIEALTALIQELSSKLHPTEDRFICKVQSVIWDQCMPLLKTISSADNGGKDLLNAVCGLFAACVRICQTDVPEQVCQTLLPVLMMRDEGRSCFNVDVATEVTAVLLSSIPYNRDIISRTLSCTLCCVKGLSDSRVSKIIVRIWFTILKSCGKDEESEMLDQIWEDLLAWHQRDQTEMVSARVLLCFTALSDQLYSLETTSSGNRPDPRRSQGFFRAVQAGLTHRDSVTRKRALYLLTRCVTQADIRGEDVGTCLTPDTDEVLFKWTAEKRELLREFWEDYAFVLETLEENQIHVIRPVLKRIDMLVETISIDIQGGLFSPSWLLCVYQRMFHSENKAVMKEGVNHLLELKALHHPAFAFAFSQFIIGPLIDVLAESSLYHRGAQQNLRDCPELGRKLQTFIVNFFDSLPEEKRGSVLLQLIQRLGSRHWCAVPLLFISQALSCLSLRPLLDSDGLQAFREVLRCTMITHQVLLRGASQCFLLHAALCLTHVSAVSLNDVFSFLVHFRAEESLCRGTALWTELCEWLQTNEERFYSVSSEDLHIESSHSKRASVFSHVQQRLNTFLTVPANSDQTGKLPDPGEAELLARAVLLTADLQQSKDEQIEAVDLKELLRPLLDILHRLSTNVYLLLHKTDKSLQLLLRLLQLQGKAKDPEKEDVVALALKTHVLSAVESVQEFLLRRLSGELKELCDVERAELYLSVLRELVVSYSGVSWYSSNLQQNYIPKLANNCLKILNEPYKQSPSISGPVQRAVSMATLALLCEMADQGLLNSQSEAMRSLYSLTDYFYPSSSSSSSLQRLNQTLLKPTAASDSSDSHTEDSPVLKDWGRIVAQFIGDQWKCLSFLQKSVPAGPPPTPEAPEVLRAAVEALALLPGHLALPVLDFMTRVFPQVAQCDESLCVEAVYASWKVVQALSTNPHDFWSTLQGFVRLAFNRELLQLTEEQNPKITACIQQIVSELMELSQVRSGVFNILIQHCCEMWLSSGAEDEVQTDVVFSSALSYINILTEACVYGPVFRRDQRLIQEVQSYIEQLGDSCAANTAVKSDNRDDQFPRVCVLAFLCRLNPSNQLHQRLMQELVQRLLKKDEEISKSKVRYYSNSIQHRVKNRVWQTLLLLLPKLTTEFVSECVLSRVCEAGFCSNQASVKYLIEWTLILILHQNPSHIQSLWNCFNMDQEKTKTSICTFLSVLVHLNILLPKLDEKQVQWQRGVEVTLQWCFSHNFSVRLYALLALKKVWDLKDADVFSEEKLGGLTTVVQACLHQAEAMQNTGNAMKNWSRIQDHFFFSVFHPIRDYSVETIFETFPRLSELAEDEWLPVWKFKSFVNFPLCASLPLKNPVMDLSEHQSGDWIQQDKGEMEQEERWAEVQKKITPWKLSVQEQEPELMAQQRAARLGKLSSDLLVVASLIDKPTNLGGLCRTCEIFRAKALVLDSLKHINDKQFQALSVSSELWLPLLEMKPVELSDFLQQKKREGYWVIGVEQTSNSQNLQHYNFPDKSLLLLGNEREGIPANLLQLVDVCVEIPQQGVTRSLNVHVSAALLVWEYTRQHLNPSTGS